MRITLSLTVAGLLLAGPAEAQRLTWTASQPPLTPREAAATLQGSIPAFTPPYVAPLGGQAAPLSFAAPQGPASANGALHGTALPPTNTWTSVTTYVPRYGPPVTWFDGQAPGSIITGHRGQRRTR